MRECSPSARIPTAMPRPNLSSALLYAIPFTFLSPNLRPNRHVIVLLFIKIILFTFTFQIGLSWPNKIIGQPVDVDFSSSQDGSVELRGTWRPPPPSPGWNFHFHSPNLNCHINKLYWPRDVTIFFKTFEMTFETRWSLHHPVPPPTSTFHITTNCINQKIINHII